MRHPQILEMFLNAASASRKWKSDPCDYYFQAVIKAPGPLFHFESRELVSRTISKGPKSSYERIKNWITSGKVLFSHVEDLLQESGLHEKLKIYHNVEEPELSLYDDSDDLYTRLMVSKHNLISPSHDEPLSPTISDGEFHEPDDYEGNISFDITEPVSQPIVDEPLVSGPISFRSLSSSSEEMKLDSPIFT